MEMSVGLNVLREEGYQKKTHGYKQRVGCFQLKLPFMSMVLNISLNICALMIRMGFFTSLTLHK